MKHRHNLALFLVLTSLTIAGCGGDDDNSNKPDAAPAIDAMPPIDATPPKVTFDVIHPIFQTKCTPCHATDRSGAHNMGADDISDAYDFSQENSYYVSGATKGEAALQRIQEGSMPLGKGCSGDPATDSGNSECLTQDEQDQIQAWIDDGQLPPP